LRWTVNWYKWLGLVALAVSVLSIVILMCHIIGGK
jgi:hypothetical protein